MYEKSKRKQQREQVCGCVREWEGWTELGPDAQTIKLKKKKKIVIKSNEKEKRWLWTPVQRYSSMPLL